MEKNIKFLVVLMLHFIDVRWESGEIICKFTLQRSLSLQSTLVVWLIYEIKLHLHRKLVFF